TPIIEWNINANLDNSPGALTTDTTYSGAGNRLLFVTRGGFPRVFLFTVPKDAKNGVASWVSHRLDAEFLGPTGGIKRLKASHDRRFVFVKTVTAVQKVDTQT